MKRLLNFFKTVAHSTQFVFRPFIKFYFKEIGLETPLMGAATVLSSLMVIKILEKMPFALELYRWNVTGCCGCIYSEKQAF